MQILNNEPHPGFVPPKLLLVMQASGTMQIPALLINISPIGLE